MNSFAGPVPERNNEVDAIFGQLRHVLEDDRSRKELKDLLFVKAPVNSKWNWQNDVSDSDSESERRELDRLIPASSQELNDTDVHALLVQQNAVRLKYAAKRKQQ